MNKKIIFPISFILILFLFGCLGEPRISASQAADSMDKIDAKADIDANVVPEFEKIKGMDLEKAVSEDIAKAMIENSTPENFVTGDVAGCTASKDSTEVMVLKFNDSESAGKYYLSLKSVLEQQGNEFLGRLNYEELSSMYTYGNKPTYFLLKNGKALVILKKK